ncbi:hypothetical protein ANN_24382 [Periplaneta americana]|uniref:Uncharacterized protein n=1 Tax=Periplaneta americana TaxID=6978 RepID=A0ABQ8S2Z1_PERAM|nr:hypothetical protein ANN_24382 [Periplaneta americana]
MFTHYLIVRSTVEVNVTTNSISEAEEMPAVRSNLRQQSSSEEISRPCGRLHRNRAFSRQVRRRPEGTKTAVNENDISSLSSELKEIDNETASSLAVKQRRSVLEEKLNDKPNDFYADLAQEISRTINLAKDGFSVSVVINEKTTDLFLPLSKTIESAAAFVKLNKEKISRIRKESKECEDKGVGISTPNKVRRPPANEVELDDMDKCIIRREVHKYSVYKELPTLGKLHKICKREREISFKGSKETLRKLLSMGLTFKKCKDKRKYQIERSDTVARYLPGRNMVPHPLHCPQMLARRKRVRSLYK